MTSKNFKLFFEHLGFMPVPSIVNETEYGFDFAGGEHPVIQETAAFTEYKKLGYPFGKSVRGLKKFTRKSQN